MSGDDVTYLRRKAKQTLLLMICTLVPSALVLMSAGINTFVKLHDKADREYVDDTYIELYVLVNAQQVNLANYMEARCNDKEELWIEIHRIQDQIHYHLGGLKNVKRGTGDTSQVNTDTATSKKLQATHWY